MIVLLFTLLLRLPAAAGPPAVRVALRPLTQQAYLEAKKAAIVTKPARTFPVKKAGGRIVIPTAKGRKLFRDVRVADDETSDITYTYEGFSAKLQQHLLRIGYYESSEWVLVEANGTISKLWSPPSCSPGCNRMLAYSSSMEYEMMPNGLQLFQAGAGGLQKVWETAPTAWAPEEAFWTSDNTAVLKQKRYPGLNAGNKLYFTYAKLTMTP